MTTETNFDVLIVGAGFAGCVVARELERLAEKFRSLRNGRTLLAMPTTAWMRMVI